MERPESEAASFDLPKWANILSWVAPLCLCAGLIWARDAAWTKGTFPGLVLTFSFGFMWVRMAVKLGCGESIPSFLRKPPIGQPTTRSWIDSSAGTFLQATAILAASVGLALFF